MTNAGGAPPPPGHGLRFDGVALVGRTAQGPTVIEGLGLAFDDQGVTIVGPQPGAERRVPWSGVSAASCGAPATTPGGRVATPLDLTSGDRTVRFFLYGDRVPGADIAQLATSLPGWLAPGATRPAAAPPAPVVTAAAVATAAVVTAAPPATPNPNTVQLYDEIESLKLDVDKIAPLHGRLTSMAEMKKMIGKSGNGI